MIIAAQKDGSGHRILEIPLYCQEWIPLGEADKVRIVWYNFKKRPTNGCCRDIYLRSKLAKRPFLEWTNEFLNAED